ncbi:MAG: hypothetical protein HYR90_03820 [Candidatus Andersenbacteria bacterium]|nr:hypothetical protein [Candidatus Andersenbacteria bacterium]MBI3250389.1 hypothetical protein [Candidatus Andersenbacteria bacterium]
MRGSWKSIALTLVLAAIGVGTFAWGYELILNDRELHLLIPIELLSLGSWISFAWTVTKP